MKMTLVVDTDDPNGIRDAYKIIGHFFDKTPPINALPLRELKYGKIGLIKLLRAFARHAKIAEERGEDSTGLKFNKLFADELFDEKYGL